MKLIYRGASYDYDAATGFPLRTSAPNRQPYALSYRGSAYTVNPERAGEPNPAPIAANLHYRGVRYALNGGKVASGNAIAARPASALKLFTTQAAAVAEASNMHRVSINRSLERRLQIAEANGDQALVQLLRQEKQQVA